MNRILRVLLLLPVLFFGCSRQPTQAEVEREVLRTIFRHYYDHDLQAEDRAEAKFVVVGAPADEEYVKGRPLIQALYRDLALERFEALGSVGISIRPVSQVAFVPAKQNWFHDPKTDERVVVFCISSISFPSPNQATVKYSSAWAPLSGGERTYHLVREAVGWRVSDGGVTAIF